MANVEFGTGKTVIILSIVAACFAVLWPKIFYPMLTGVPNKKSGSDNLNGCCDVIFETDVNAIRIMTEMCGTILNRQEDFNPKLSQAFQQGKLTKEVINTCRTEVMNVCGIDIAEFLSKKEKLGHSYKQMLDEIRSFNISVCLRHNFGVNPGLLGAPRRMRIWGPTTSKHLRQERPLHFRSEMVHPALREKGRAIPPSHFSPKVSHNAENPSKPIFMPGSRPPMGGAGHVVPPPKVGGTMNVVMPLYTFGVVIFFMYTIVKVFLKRSGASEKFEDFQSDPEFRRVVFSEDYSNGCAAKIGNEGLRVRGKQEFPRARKSPSNDSTRLGWKERDTRDSEIDHLRKRLEETERAMERIVAHMETVPTELFNKVQKVNVMTAITGLLAEINQQLNKEGDTQTQYSTELKAKKLLEEVGEEPIQKTKELDLQVEITKNDPSWVKNGQAKDILEEPEEDDSKPKVKVVGLELMAECEGGQKWSRPATPNLGVGGSSRSTTPIPPPYSPEPQNIFLEGSLPQQSQLLVTDSKTQALTLSDGDEPEPPVILSSKMTLSLISLDAALNEENPRQDQPASPIQVDVKSNDDNYGSADSTLLDIDSEVIDETGQYESSGIEEQGGTGAESEQISKPVNEILEEDPTTNYTTATMSERAEAGLAPELEDTAADVSNLDGLDLTEDQDDLQNGEVQLWNGNEKEAEEQQEQESPESGDQQQQG